MSILARFLSKRRYFIVCVQDLFIFLVHLKQVKKKMPLFGRIAPEMSIFASFFVKKGVFFTVCVYTAIAGREPRHTGPPKRVPSRTYALLTVAIFRPQGHQSLSSDFQFLLKTPSGVCADKPLGATPTLHLLLGLVRYFATKNHIRNLHRLHTTSPGFGWGQDQIHNFLFCDGPQNLEDESTYIGGWGFTNLPWFLSVRGCVMPTDSQWEVSE